MSQILPNQRHLFDIPDDVAYLNCAYMSPLPLAAAERGSEGLRQKTRPWEIGAEDFFTCSEAVRSEFAKLLGTSADHVAIVPSVSYGTAVAAANVEVPSGSRVVVLSEQFPSNYYVWKERVLRADAELVVVERPEQGTWSESVVRAIGPKTSVVAVPHCHWTDGTRLDLETISEACRQSGASLVVDGTQSVGAMPLDLATVKPDFLCTAGYKWLMGPYSVSFLYCAEEYFEGQPIEFNWIARQDSENFAGLVDYTDAFQAGARRFDVGERSNFALLPASLAGLQMLDGWTVPAIADSIARLTARIVEGLSGTAFRPTNPSERSPHLIGLRLPSLPVGLKEELDRANVYVSVRGSSIRVAPHIYNTEADVDRLVESLLRVVQSP